MQTNYKNTNKVIKSYFSFDLKELNMNFNKFIPRPIVVKKYNKVSEEGARCYNEEKRELNFLFKDFTNDKYIIEMRRLSAKIGELKRETERLFKRNSQFKRVESNISYSQKLAKGSVPDPQAVSSLPVKIEPQVKLWSNLKAKRDYSHAFNKMKKERAAALALVKAIAARKPIIRFSVKDRVVLCKDRIAGLKALLRERRWLAKHPAKEVETFPLGCYFDKPSVYQPSVKVEEVKGVARATSVKQIKRINLHRFSTTENYVNNSFNYKLKDTSSRLSLEEIKFLKFKIKLAILKLKDFNKFIEYIDSKVNSLEGLEPQMDTDGVVESSDNKIVDLKSNTAIQSSSAVETDKFDLVSSGFSNLSVSEESQTFRTITDRWLFMEQIEWKKNSDELYCKEYPIEINSKSSAQLTQLLYINRFWRFNLKFKFVLNSSPFQTGMVVCDFLYGFKEDNSHLLNVFSAIQRNHVKLSAGSSNDAELIVPYHHQNSYLSNKSKECVIGTLSIRTLVSLASSDTVANSASISIFVSLEQYDGHGLLSREIGIKDITSSGIQGQMETIGELCNAGSNVLRTVGSVFNRDNPPLPLQPISLVPQTIPSMAYTDGICEPINVLRADSRGQRVQPVYSNECELRTLLSGWGFLKQFKWSFSNAPGSQLWATDVKPLFPFANYPAGTSTGTPGVYSYILPPIGVLSSLAGKFRGDIEFRFEIVANSFYTGSLQISMVPLGTENEESFDNTSLSLNIVSDIRKSNVIDFVCPWNWYNAWARTRSLYSNGNSIGRLYVKVVNNLIGIANVPNTIYVNVYMRGGNNFELAQLKTPLASLVDTVVRPPSDFYLIPYNTETKWYSTYSKQISYTNDAFITVYIQNVTNGWVGYTGVEEFQVYKLSDRLLSNYFFRCYMETKQGKFIIKYGVYHEGLSTANAHGLVCFATLAKAKMFVANVAKKGYKTSDCDKFLKDNPDVAWKADGAWSETSHDGKTWSTAINASGDHPIWFKESVADEYEYELVGQMDHQSTSITLEKSAPATSFGLTTYGERMPDLKGVARRWQHYDSFIGNTCGSKFPRDCPYLFKFPVKPQRDIEPISSASYDNRVRNGSIGLINSGFFLWDGGMRYRIVASHNVPDDATVYIQHRFDDETASFNSVVPGPSRVSSAKDMMDTHYATFVQCLSVNPISTVEIPYYRSEERLICSTTTRANNNGYVYVWVHTAKPVEVHFEIYYSVADDFQWSVFQGFPAMIDIAAVPNEPTGQMDPEGTVESQGVVKDVLHATRLLKSVKPETVEKTQEAVESIAEDSKEAIKNINTVTSKISDLIDSLKDIPSKVFNGASQGLDAVKSLASSAFDFISHLVYCIISPTPLTIGWAVVNIFHKIWGINLKTFSQISNAVSNLWDKVRSATQQPQPTGQMETDEVSSLCSLVYCSVCMALKLKAEPPRDWKSISKGLFEFGQVSRLSGFVTKFFSDNIELLRRIWSKILDKFSFSDSARYKLIAGVEDNRLRAWLINASSMTNPSIKEKVQTNPLWSEKIFELAVVGRGIVAQLSMEKKVPPQLYKTVVDLLNKLTKTEETLINRKVFCGERYEPFCLWAYGAAGTGKTRYLQNIATRLADMSKGSSPQTYHTITIGQQYFDGFVGQKSVLIDDFLTMSPTLDSNIPLFIQMKSSALFNPPYSDIKDKTTMVNFENLLISSNFASVSNLPGIHDESAYNRRRDCLLEFRAVDAARLKKKDYTLEEYEDMVHADVYVISDVLKPNKSEKFKIERKANEKYSNTVWKYIEQKALKYHIQESKNFEKRIRTKLERLDKHAQEGLGIEEYLTRASQLFKVAEVDEKGNPSKDWTGSIRETSSNLFSNWIHKDMQTCYGCSIDKPSTSKCNHLEEEASVEPQGEGNVDVSRIKEMKDNHYWPFSYEHVYAKVSGSQRVEDFRDGEILEPLTRRSCYMGPMIFKDMCLHNLVLDEPDNYSWDEDLRAFTFFSAKDDNDFRPTGCLAGPCLIKTATGLSILPTCSFVKNPELIINKFFNNTCRMNPDLLIHLKATDTSGINEVFPESWFREYLVSFRKSKEEVEYLSKEPMDRMFKAVKLAQKRFAEGSVLIGDVVVPQKSVWRRIGDKMWESLKSLFKLFFKAIYWLKEIVAILVGLSVIFTGVKIGVNCYKEHKLNKTLYPDGTPFDQWYKEHPGQGMSIKKALDLGDIMVQEKEAYLAKQRLSGEIHPSGDYKMMKNAKSLKSQALSLVQGEIPELTDENIIDYATTDNSSDKTKYNIVKKIASNVFTLIGIANIEGSEQKLTFKARCIGIANYDFIVLKHYIDHFKAHGVTEVAILYRDNKGLIYFKLDDIKFQWTKQGYGVGTLPSAAKPFKKITQFMPSEDFDGSYPRKMLAVEVTHTDIILRELECTKLYSAVTVPSTYEQQSWTIEQGFRYEWGGRGKCGTFLFAPEMACPLVGVHTAGIETRVGYSEMLLRETFENNKILLDHVLPQMETNDTGFQLPGPGYVLGHVKKDKAVSLPNKTKIVPSEIAGVFPVLTEPAPLSIKDERIADEPFDPLLEGISKRCDKPQEFPEGYLNAAFHDFKKKILTMVPVRNPEKLTISQAIEGLTLPGYDPMAITTSEGYPWTLDRPAGFSDKQWLFSFENYPDGRRKLIGIDSKLLKVLNLKEEMRSRLVIPTTYYTACLKDARISKEKIKTPGKTRVFEMSPVDLTIVQRQYFLDFYVSYQTARFKMENTIGINADGVEWTELVNRLTEFSPYILTADYSGYGPRLLQSVQFKAYLVEAGWYDHWQTKNGYEAVDDEFINRYVLIHEMLNTPTIVKDALVCFNTGMPSGNAGTVIKNSECNSLMIRIIYMVLAKKYAPHYNDMYWFNKFVLLFSNGDDLIMAVKEDIIKWFNNRTLIEAFADFNIKMTDALKSGKVREYCSIEEATYLKRGFMKHPTREGQWLAPLEEASITDTANWIWKCVDERAASLVNSEMSARLAYTRGPDYYNKIVEKLQKSWLDKGVNFQAPSWESLDSHVWEGTEGPLFCF